MNIGIVTTSYPRYLGDRAGVFVFNLVEGLRKLGHSIKVIAPEVFGETSPEPLEDVCRVRFYPHLAGRIAYGAGIMENIRKKPFLLFGIPGFLRSIEKTVHRELGSCELIDASFTAAGIAVARARRPYQAIVYTGHGTDIHMLDKSCLYRRYFSNLLSKFDSVTVVSNNLANKLIEHRCHSNPVVIHNGVHEETFGYVSPWRSEPTAIYASRFIEVKRPLLLIRAWTNVAHVMPNARLIMFGDGPLLPKSKKLAQRFGLTKSVEFRGMVPTREVWTEMGRGWLTVLPSMYEGLPPLLLESLAAGAPFLASPMGAAPELATETGGGFILPDLLTREKLGSSIISALSDKGKLQEMGKKGQEKVARRYLWDKIAQRKATLYSETFEAFRRRRSILSPAP